MSRRRADIDDESSSAIDTIRGICNGGNCKGSAGVNTIKAIHATCDKYDRKLDTKSSPSTIDAIREVCNDFNIRPNYTNPCNAINTIRSICNHEYYDMPYGNSKNLLGLPSYDRKSYGGMNNECSSYSNHHCERYDPGTSYFNSVITPVTVLTPQYSGVTGSVEFRMRRKNKTVTLQWEPFTGTMAASGVAFLTVAQSIWNTPPYPMSWPIYIQYKGVSRVINITVDPSSTTGNIKFYLNTDGTGSNVNIGDAFYIYAGSVSWIVD